MTRIDGNGGVIGGVGGFTPAEKAAKGSEAQKASEQLAAAFKPKATQPEKATPAQAETVPTQAKFEVAIPAKMADLKAQIENLQVGESFEFNGTIYKKEGENSFVNPEHPNHEVTVSCTSGKVVVIHEFERGEHSSQYKLYNQLIIRENGDIRAISNERRPDGSGPVTITEIKDGVTHERTKAYGAGGYLHVETDTTKTDNETVTRETSYREDKRVRFDTIRRTKTDGTITKEFADSGKIYSTKMPNGIEISGPAEETMSKNSALQPLMKDLVNVHKGESVTIKGKTFIYEGNGTFRNEKNGKKYNIEISSEGNIAMDKLDKDGFKNYRPRYIES